MVSFRFPHYTVTLLPCAISEVLCGERLWDYIIIPFLILLLSNSFSIFSWLLSEFIIIMMVAKWWFLSIISWAFFFLFSTLLIKKSFLFCLSYFIYLTYQCGLVNSNCIKLNKFIRVFICYVYSITLCPIWNQLPFQDEFASFLCPYNALLYRLIRCSRGIWYFPCSRLALRRIIFRTKIWVQHVLVTTGYNMLLWPSQ